MFELKEFLLFPTWACLRLARLFVSTDNPLKKMNIGSFASWSQEATDVCVVIGAFVLISVAMFTPALYALLTYAF